jgi:hypothetical protein
MQQISKYKRRYERLKLKPAPSGPSVEQMTQAVEKLVKSNKAKTEKIARLKDIVRRQHDALQKLVGSESGPTRLVSLRSVMRQLVLCDVKERGTLADQARAIIHEMKSVNVT